MDIILIRIRLIPYTISYGGRSLLQVKPITSIYTYMRMYFYDNDYTTTYRTDKYIT